MTVLPYSHPSFREMVLLLFLLAVCLLNSCARSDESKNGSLTDNERLFRDLFKDYDLKMRPVKDWRTVINATVKFHIMQLYGVIAPRKVFEVVASVTVKWNDEYLKWDPADYGGLSRIYYPHQLVWKPEFLLLNAAELDFAVMEKASTNVEIKSSGRVINSYISFYKPTCSAMDVTYFPFDRHQCFFLFGSWTYSADELDWEVKEQKFLLDSEKLVPNAEWEIEVVGQQVVKETKEHYDREYPYIKIEVQLKRKPLFYVFNIIAPTVIMCVVAFVGMFTPSSSSGERTEKMNLGMSALLAISVLMLMVSSFVPISGDQVMVISWVMGFFYGLVAVATQFTAVVLMVDSQGSKGRPVPKWARKYLINELGKVLFVQRLPKTLVSEVSLDGLMQMDSSQPETGSQQQEATTLRVASPKPDTKPDPAVQQQICALLAKMTSIDVSLRKILARKSMKEKEAEFRAEWSCLATVIERLFFFVCVAGGVVATVYLKVKLRYY